jgi:hypothetical protein
MPIASIQIHILDDEPSIRAASARLMRSERMRSRERTQCTGAAADFRKPVDDQASPDAITWAAERRSN